LFHQESNRDFFKFSVVIVSNSKAAVKRIKNNPSV